MIPVTSSLFTFCSLLRWISESISRILYTRREKFVGSETDRSIFATFHVSRRVLNAQKRLHEQCARALTCVVTRDIQQMSVYRGKTMNRGVRTCVRANAWPGVGVSQTRMWILVAHPYDKVRSPYCFPCRKWYLKPFAKTSPTGLSPYSRGYIAYVRTYVRVNIFVFPSFFVVYVIYRLTGKQASRGM